MHIERMLGQIVVALTDEEFRLLVTLCGDAVIGNHIEKPEGEYQGNDRAKSVRFYNELENKAFMVTRQSFLGAESLMTMAFDAKANSKLVAKRVKIEGDENA